MAETIEKSQLIDINGLSVFKEKMDASVNTKIAEAGQGVTYTLSRNSNNEIVLTGSDKSETKVTDENTTYSFTQSGTVLTVTPSDGEPIEVTLGVDITEETISEWGFTKNTGTYSKPSDGIPKADLSNDVQESLNKANTALQSFKEQDPTVPSHVKSISTSDISKWDAKSDFSGDYNDLSNKPTIPTVPDNISAFNNDSGYITKAVNDLTNYYKKSETYTQSEVNALISAIPKFVIDVVDSLPTSEISSTTIYLLKTSETETGNLYTEYIYLNGQWETLGTQTLDLSGYATTTALSTELDKKVDKVNGKGLSTNDLTSALKSNYDSAYTHSTSVHAPSNAQVNVIETVKVNGTALTPSSKAVNITVPTKASDIGAATELTQAQLNAVNSGITSDKVVNYDKCKNSVDAMPKLVYATCSTAAATQVKEITLDDSNYTLKDNDILVVLFSQTNTFNSTADNKITFNVTGQSYNVYYDHNKGYSTGINSTFYGYANRCIYYIVDATNKECIYLGHSWDNNTTYSNAALGQGYATCSTAASTTAKVASLGSYSLVTGGIVACKFTYDVPASATLNINSKGAKSIYYRGKAITTGVIKAGDIATFIYSSQYHLISIDRDNNTTYSSKSAVSGGTDVSLVTTGEKYTWNNKGTYSKPSGGIPKSDLSSDVQSSLDNAELIGDLNTDVTALKGTTITGTLSAGQTSLVLSNSAITTNSTIDYYVDRFGVSATNIVVTSGKITMTFKAQSSALNIKVIVR